jgi:hypothetical protein
MSSWDTLVIPPTPPLFSDCEGIRFFGPKNELFVLHAGAYGTGNGALWITAGDGEPECKLTVNLAPSDAHDDLHVDEFYVKVEEVGRLERFILAMGFFRQTGEWADAGYVRRYADKWTFATCQHQTHAIRCPACREAHEQRVKDKETQIKAQDSLDRLRGDKERAR